VAVIGETGSNPDDQLVYVFDQTQAGWPKKPTITLTDPEGSSQDGFGAALSVSTTDFVVGSPSGNSDEGVAYIYEDAHGT
jgi:hypothetical protein